MPTPNALRQLADRALDGHLDELLCKGSDAGFGRRAAAKLLELELGVRISPPTVERWTDEALAARDKPNGAAA